MSVRSYHNDPDLLARFIRGDAEAFNDIYTHNYLRVFQYARRFIPEREDAEDLTADTFVKLWERRAQFESLNNIEAFLHITVRNGCLDFLRRLRVKADKREELQRRLIANLDGDFAREEILAAFMDLIYEEVKMLPPKMREIFLLSYKEGLKPAEIAERLNLSAQTVRNQKTNAVSLLRLALANKPLLLALLFFLDADQEWMA